MFPAARQVPLWNQFIDDEVAPPITLHINQESRYETLRHYQIVWPHEYPGFNSMSPVLDCPLIIDTDKDTIVLKSRTDSDIMQYTFVPTPNQTAQRIAHRLPRTPLEIANLEGPRLWTDYLDSALKGGLKSIKYVRVMQSGFTHLQHYIGGDAGRGLQRFKGLKEVILVYLNSTYFHRNADREKFLAVAKYRDYKDNITGFEMPDIKIEFMDAGSEVRTAKNFGI